MAYDHPRVHVRAGFPRVRLRFPQGRDYQDLLLRDLSVGGVFAMTDHTLPVGSELEIEIIVVESSEPLMVTGRVVRIQVGGEVESRGMAIEFQAPSPEVVSRIDHVVETFLERAGRWNRPMDALARPAADDRLEKGVDERGIEIDLELLEPSEAPEKEKAEAEPIPVDSTTESSFATLSEEEEEPAQAGEEVVSAATEAPDPDLTVEQEAPSIEGSPSEPEERAGGIPSPSPADSESPEAEAEAEDEDEDEDEETLGPGSVASREDFVEYLVNGSELRTTERYHRLEPVSRNDIRVSDWLKEANTLAAIQELADGRMSEPEILSVLHVFFERCLIRVTA